jgi:hypothetical protein
MSFYEFFDTCNVLLKVGRRGLGFEVGICREMRTLRRWCAHRHRLDELPGMLIVAHMLTLSSRDGSVPMSDTTTTQGNATATTTMVASNKRTEQGALAPQVHTPQEIWKWTLSTDAIAPCFIRDVFSMTSGGVKGMHLSKFDHMTRQD